ncbi:MAG: DNA-3-methyladenine glycosylase 2 family protein [Bacteroidetes bacterium]|nr:DNA-3-methyladenine glycosylase 2 family protein [Bacteroidota bacterium]
MNQKKPLPNSKKAKKVSEPISFNKETFHTLCDSLAKKDKHLKEIINRHGYPPTWKRKPNFETLIHIILEQQVSLASAKAALNKLKEKLGAITPKNLLALTDAEMKACYFSRQKIVYARALALSIENGELSIESLKKLADEEIRLELKKIKGIGDWTVDVFLLMVLQRTDIFPTGDLAMMNSLKKHKQLAPTTSKEAILVISEKWKPYRSIASMIFWHAYIIERNIQW